jgi:5-methylcytosine-specific restriction enzyme A
MLPGPQSQQININSANEEVAKIRKPPTPCSKCGRAVKRGGLCAFHLAQYDKRRRPTATQRGYGAEHRERFRAGVLERGPDCVLCGELATVADHYPLTRRELVDMGADPDDPANGRGLCKPCHDRHTGQCVQAARKAAEKPRGRRLPPPPRDNGETTE